MQEVVDLQSTASVTMVTLQRSFPEELEELERVAAGDLKAAIELIRDERSPSLPEISTTMDAIRGFMVEHCRSA